MEEDSDADSNYEEPLAKKKKLIKKRKTLKKELEEEGSGEEEDSQKLKKKKLEKPKKKRVRAPAPRIERTEHQKKVALKTLEKIYQQTDTPSLPLKREIAEVLLTTTRNVSRFMNYRRNKERNQGKYVKVNKEISKKLEELFKINPNPTTERKKEIAEANKLKLQAVSNWFMNKRDRLKNPEKWEELNERKRFLMKRQHMKTKAHNQLNGIPPKVIFFDEDQKNYMRARFQEFNLPTTKQCELWGQEINLTGTQVYNFIKKVREFSRPGVREQRNKRKRERQKGAPKKHYRFVPKGHPPLSEEEALPIIKRVLEENPDYVETKNGVLMNQIYWPKYKINNYIRHNLQQEPSAKNGKFLEEEFQKHQSISLSHAKDLSKTLGISIEYIRNWFSTQKRRTLEKYLDEKQELDRLPAQMKILEIEYLKNNVINSIEVAERIGGVKIALGYFRMRRKLDRKRGKKVPEEKDVPKVRKRRQSKKPSKKQAITQEESSDDSDESYGDSDDSDDSDDSEKSFTDSDEWDSDDDDEVDKVFKREPKEEPEDE
ncbi:hypothetical protein GCK72_020354 [Caenorhabditis remanei]|uniref:Homeobox domain-containing protein n=1 Tax=Caenorhabditis remanei TaxID=31234 RepID=A0A6A5GEY5_CAERE|nr:hypothetical protein GCK72_020354 [Caenorhabditis remanei]KAF1753797.1 hypothetical protein GCK72_020354 [Caenorhabditis remanei]